MADTRLVILKTGGSATRLADDLYHIPEAGAERARRAAAQAITEANPHITGLATIPEGTPIVVPELPGLQPRVEAAAAPPATVLELMEQANAALNQVRSSLAEARDAAVSEAKDTIGILRSREFKAATADSVLAERIAAINAAANQTIKDADTVAKAEEAGLNELEAALKEISAALG